MSSLLNDLSHDALKAKAPFLFFLKLVEQMKLTSKHEHRYAHIIAWDDFVFVFGPGCSDVVSAQLVVKWP